MECKDLEVKNLETKIEKTQFKVKVPTSETRYKEDVEAPTSSLREVSHILADYQLTRIG